MTNGEKDQQAPARERVKVLFPLPLPASFDYFLPPGARAEPGTFVVAPFGPREAIGVIWPEPPDAGLDSARLKQIAEIIDGPLLSRGVLDFIAWTADYTMFPLGSVLRMVMRSGDFISPPRMLTAYRATGMAPDRATPQRTKVLEAAGDVPMTAADLAGAAGAGRRIGPMRSR